MKAFALFLACCLWDTSVFAQTRVAERIAEVKAEFAGKSLSEINSALASIRPAAVKEADKHKLLRNLPLITAANLITDIMELNYLKARLESALRLHDRVGVVELVVFRDPRPIVYNKPGVVVVLSTEVLRIVGNTDAALVGVVSHELAHEYVAMPMLYAVQVQDTLQIQRLELFCDAVAVITLLTLHLDPAGYCKALKQICRHSLAAKSLNDGTGSHPALAVRLKLIDEIWRSCKLSS